MTENEARDWVAMRFGTAAVERLTLLATWVAEENARQNLVSPTTIATIWTRHIVDSLQLVPLATETGRWIDIGTGGGFPGLPVAIVREQPAVLVEPRRRRAEFLDACRERLCLTHVTVEACRIEGVTTTAAVISARAVATIEKLLQAAAHCATRETRWLLPRGTVERSELVRIARQHEMVFHVEQSLTAADSSIVVLCAR